MTQATIKPLMSARRVSLIGAMLAAIGPVSMALYTPAMPEIVNAFGTTEAAVKMSLSLYFAGFAFAQLICGPISDGLGRRPVTVAFMAIYTVSSFLAVFAPDIETLIVARLLLGVGAAAGIAVSRAIVRDLFQHEEIVADDSSCWKRSRTMARDMAMPAAAPTPCNSRATMSVSISGANTARKLDTV